MAVDVWESLTDTPGGSQGGHMGICFKSPNIWLFGLNVLHPFDISTLAWGASETPPNHQGDPVIGVVDDVIYAAGGSGSGGGSVVALCQAYDIGADTWSVKTPLPSGRKLGCGGTYGGKLYYFGGIDSSNNIFDSTLVYDPVTDSWTGMTPMPEGRYSLTAALVNGVFYLIGGSGPGFTTRSTVYAYNVGTDTWESLAPMSVAKSGVSSVAIGGLIHCIGNTGSYSQDHWVYNPESNSWDETSKTEYPASKGFLSSVYTGFPYIHVMGGRDSSGASLLHYRYDTGYYTTQGAGASITVPELLIPRKQWHSRDMAMIKSSLEKSGVPSELAGPIAEGMFTMFDTYALDEYANYRSIETWVEDLQRRNA